MATKKHKPTKIKSPTILYRSETNKILGGVCGGLGEVFSIDATLIRVLFVLAMLFGGSGLLFYIILWVVIPTRSKLTNTTDENIRENLDEMKEKVQSISKDFSSNRGSDSRPIAGMIVIVLGVIFLLGNFGYIHIYSLSKLWPVFLILAGLVLITKKSQD